MFLILYAPNFIYTVKFDPKPEKNLTSVFVGFLMVMITMVRFLHRIVSRDLEVHILPMHTEATMNNKFHFD